jgi:hypothetical protein
LLFGSRRALRVGAWLSGTLKLYKKSLLSSAMAVFARCSRERLERRNDRAARYKSIDGSAHFLRIVLESQLVPGSSEHALDVLIDTEIDLSRPAAHYCNDETGTTAYEPAVVFKIVLLVYSRGVISSRGD